MKQDFLLLDHVSYLNHAAIGVWPHQTCAAVQAFAKENMQQGATDYPRWLAVEQRCRRRLGKLLNIAEQHVSLLKNTSEGLSIIAMGFPWQRGDNIVISSQEFPSNRIVWESLQARGVELRIADIDVDEPEAAMIACCDQHTRMISVSSVQYATGLRMRLEQLGEYCRSHDVFFCVDAIQSLGAFPFDAMACHADAVVADAHKWLCGPEGIAVFYLNPEWWDRIQLQQFGWHMVEEIGDFDCLQWREANSGRRFEPGSPNMLGIHALEASLAVLESYGINNIASDICQRVDTLFDHIQQDKRLQSISSQKASRRSGIVSFNVKGKSRDEHALLYQQLMKRGVICAHRAGGIRFSPHYYTPSHVIGRAWQVFDSLLESSSLLSRRR